MPESPVLLDAKAQTAHQDGPVTSQKEEKGVGKKDHPEGQKEPWGIERL